jgi:hypothetical protein
MHGSLRRALPPERHRFVVTTVVRGAPVGSVSGRIYVVDAERRRTLMAAPVFETPWAWAGSNFRGGHRGGRGITTAGDRLAIANADEIHVFDRAWERTAVLSDPSIGDIHELAADDDGVWVCATRADRLVRLGWDGAVLDRWSWRDDPALVRRFGYRTVAPIDDALDHRVMRDVNPVATDLSHVNGVTRNEAGLLVGFGRVRIPSPTRAQRAAALAGAAAHAALAGRPLTRRLRAERIRRWGADPQPGAIRRGMILELTPGRPAEVLVDRSLAGWPNHNQLEHGRELVLCDTSRGCVVAVDRDTGAERTVAVPQAESFLRGLAWLGDDRFLVGTRRPAALHVVDFAGGHAELALRLSGEWHESVHDVEPLPDAWDDPPARL